jgi:hypothetical protein
MQFAADRSTYRFKNTNRNEYSLTIMQEHKNGNNTQHSQQDRQSGSGNEQGTPCQPSAHHVLLSLDPIGSATEAPAFKHQQMKCTDSNTSTEGYRHAGNLQSSVHLYQKI